MTRRYDVCAAVVSDLAYDARVWKEVRSLAGAGYRVRLIGCTYADSDPPAPPGGAVDLELLPLGTRAGRPSLARRARTLTALWLEVARTAARVYHAHNVHVLPAAWLAARLRRAALVYDAHELYGAGEQRSLAQRVVAAAERLAERAAVAGADVVITTNGSRVEELRRRHGDARYEVIANVPPLAEAPAPLDPGFPAGAPTLLYQGGIYADSRAFRETIEALAALDGVHLVVLGFGRERDIAQVRTWADAAGVGDRVHVLPPRPFDELVRTAAAATIGLVPIRPDTLNNYLGDTNKLFEYLMAGLPVAASDIPEIRRVVLSSTPPVGELFDPASPASIAAAVRRLLADPRELAERRRTARRLAASTFNWSVEEERLLEVYSSLMPAGSGADA